MSEAKFKTLRHIETVRNYLGLVIKEFVDRSIKHDQSKLESPEVDVLEVYTEILRKMTYGSQEYKNVLKNISPAVSHHYTLNSHHPEHYSNFIHGMDLFDLLEMICDWKAASLRHNDGDIYKSLEINREKYNMSDELYSVLKNTINFIQSKEIYNKANES